MASMLVVVYMVQLILHNVSPSGGSSHWVVTEDGRIQAQLDTVFNMKRPYDLVAFMRQEERSGMLDKLKDELLSRKDEIDKNEDRDTGLEQRFYKTDPDCLMAVKPLPEFDLYISTVLPLENKGIRPEDHIDMKSKLGSTLMAPNCEVIEDLSFSMDAFEHLEGMKDRLSLSGTPELGLKNAITYHDSVDEYGHRVFEALKKNTTSWVLYNMAAFFWRIKGDPYMTIECLRRALHYSPRMHKDVALISLANVLHRARYSNEAAIVVHAALDVSKELNVNHFTLGNIYAVMAEYNKSVICFENTLKIQPDFKAAAERKYAVLCHAKLEAALEAQHRSLQKTLNDLKDYQKKHDYWQQQNEKLMAEQVPANTKINQHVAHESLKMQQTNVEIGEFCQMVDRDGRQVLMCTWGKKSMEDEMDFTMFGDFNNGNLVDINKREGDEEDSSIIDYTKPVRAPLYTNEKKLEAPKYNNPDSDWPTKDECDTYVQKVPDPRNLSTIYLSPENKGFEVKALLTEAQNLLPEDEHPLPWYPPVCVPLMEIPEGQRKTHDHIKSVSYDQRTRIPLKLTDPSMFPILIGHVNDGIAIEEIGQRLLTALKQKIGPGWVLYNLAGLYWRIIGNNYQGVECIRRSLTLVPDEYRDVPLVNLANILYRWGRFEDAVTVMKDALIVNDLEPESHYFYANLLWATKNYTGAVKHYEKSLDILPESQDTFNNLRAIKCYLKFHHATQSAAAAKQSKNQGCQTKGGSNDNQETESRVICKNENGEEKCVIETRSRTKSGECNGHCTQTCTVTPIKFDSCTGDEGPMTGSPCSQKGPNQPFPNSADEPNLGGDFSDRLDEVSEHYLSKGVCEGEECGHLKVQCTIPVKTGTGSISYTSTLPKYLAHPIYVYKKCLHGGQRPHIKLEVENGVLHQKLIFAQSAEELYVEPHECVIFNDGTKSSGCNRPEYKNYLHSIITNKIDYEQVELILMEHLNAQNDPKHQEKCSGKTQSCSCSQTTSSDVKPPKGPIVEKIEKVTLTWGSEDSNPNKPDVSDGKEQEIAPVEQLPDSELPDTTHHIGRRYHIAMPSVEECQNMPKVDFTEYTSTFLCVSAKGVDLRKHIDFETVIKRSLEEPVCMTDFYSTLEVDVLPGTRNKLHLNYHPENVLKEVLQKLGGEKQPVEVIGTRIAQALKKNMTSWVLASTAALYWRVEGDAKRAIDCLRLALTTAPRDVQDTALISLANILHRSGYLNDAIVTTDMALDVPDKLVVSHFTMANLYAAKGQWDKATMFYESTLGLQSSFEAAKHRLKRIKCRFVMQRPENQSGKIHKP
ncbi:tetratricopeptide repeat protein 17-like isoform X2 [Ostrea edulis]|uniref:tetratricopeptide repeat protein 17-like isoform X2 n=1 Tax=Ostrea edulis TaxID=37623 RepID=UPI002094B5E0|nr:tetratricopeptide repeat protein 17-like isoform X2 [Ostrea edulis]